MQHPPRLALIICLLLAVLHTWPLGSAPASRSLHHNADSQTFEWTLSWIARAIVRDPLNLFHGNVFAPEPRVLTYADPIIVPGLIGAPARWLGASPVLTFNLVLIAGLTLTAWAGWFVAWKWTGSASAAMVAGALMAFNAHLLTRLPHIPASHLWGLPLTLYLADRLMETPRRRDGVLLALVVAATAATSLYSLFFAGLVIGLVMLVGLARWRSAIAVAGASLVGILVALPVLWPYVDLAKTGATRPIDMVAQFSATPAGYLTSLSHLHAGWTARFLRDDVNVLFAGVTAVLCAGAGIVVAGRQAEQRRRVLTMILIAVAGVWLSFGPATAAYRWLYDWVPPLRALRAAARFGYLYLMAITLMAAFGVAWLERRVRSSARSRLVSVVVLSLVTAEAWSAPIHTEPFRRIPPLYDLVAETTTPVMLVELPFFATDLMFGNGEYMLNATAHWKPVMNGYSGAIPDSYRRRSSAFWFFPELWTMDAIKNEGATHVMVHLERFSRDEQAAIQRALEPRKDFRLLGTDALGHRLYVVER